MTAPSTLSLPHVFAECATAGRKPRCVHCWVKWTGTIENSECELRTLRAQVEIARRMVLEFAEWSDYRRHALPTMRELAAALGVER